MSVHHEAAAKEAVSDPPDPTKGLEADGEQVGRDVIALRERATFYDLEAHYAVPAQVGPAQEQARRLRALADRLDASRLTN